MELTHYVNYTCEHDTWKVESNGDITDLAILAPIFSRCDSLGCNFRMTANGAAFDTDGDFRLCYHPTRGTTVETPVVAIQTARRLLDGIEAVINDYRDELDRVMECFLQNDFIGEDEE